MSAPSLDHLRTFVTVHRTGSLTRAAQLLGLSQATVSAHVQAVEAVVGFPVFERGRAGVTTTAKGLELARRVAAHLDAIEDAVSPPGLGGDAERAVHVGGPAEILSLMVVPRIAELIAAANAPVRLTFGLAQELLDALAGGALDVVVSAVPPQREGLTAVPFYDEEFVLVAAPTWAGRDPETVPVVAYAENLPIVRRYWRSIFDRAPSALRVAAVIPDLRGIREAVLGGVGMSVLPAYMVAEDLRSGGLIALDEPEVAPLNTLYLATRSGDAERFPAVSAVVDTLRRFIA
ncbi:LysR family transcriptional regulator [Microbacterium sp. 13-71-7]|uniref:LysR family transcriptional regulator n=1 Tax=Microbacterium sp. 13-71-7 TaxID=1970399 RepID=UPI000BDDB276|nr:LysR family transcriptional regulator [Microbacterium sp. 13-71-7]OZB84235.1 MAG: LysR family transcriptional regulator [Microbacterium sp. 13-71-7]